MTLVVAITLLCLQFVFVIANVDGSSMEPGLLARERLFVWRLQYAFAEPERGDIVMCYYPVTGKRHYVKRIIGLPGETLEITGGRVYINGEALAEAYIDEDPIADVAPITIEEGHYYVMGDNRNHSTDSRHPSVGPLAREDIAGKAVLLFWPLSRAQTFQTPYYDSYIPYGAGH